MSGLDSNTDPFDKIAAPDSANVSKRLIGDADRNAVTKSTSRTTDQTAGLPRPEQNSVTPDKPAPIDVSKEPTPKIVPSDGQPTARTVETAKAPTDNSNQPPADVSRTTGVNPVAPASEARIAPVKDVADPSLPPLKLVETPSALSSNQRIQPGALPGADARVVDPVVRVPDLGATPAKAVDASTRGVDVPRERSLTGDLVRAFDHTGKDPGVGNLAGSATKFEGVVSKEPTPRQPSEITRANADVAVKSDGVRSGVDHMNQGILARGNDPRSEGIRSAQLSPADGKIAELRTGAAAAADGNRTGRASMTPLEGKIADRVGDRVGDRVNDKTGEKFGDKPGDKSNDGKPAGRDGNSSGGPSAFIQFIENQAGLRGIGIPAKDKVDKPEKTDKSDKAQNTELTGKVGKAQNTELVGKPDKAQNTELAGKVDKTPFVKNDGVKSESQNTRLEPKGGTRSGVVDNFVAMVETFKDNIKSALKTPAEKVIPTVPLNPGELAVVGRRGKIPPVSENINSAQIVAVLIPAGFVNWSIVKSPDKKPSDKPAPDSAKRAEARPFDVNHPPDAKPRPFIQLHGADSEYKSGNKPAPQPVRSDVRVEVPVDKPVATPDAKTAPAVVPWLDEPGKVRADVPPNAQSLIDQSSTRQSIPPEAKSRQQLIEEQEHTLPVNFEDSAETAGGEPSEQVDSADNSHDETQSEKRIRYVNRAIDAQEATWNSEDEEVNSSMQAPLGRYTYIVRSGDSVESVAVAELNDATLAPLIFRKNRKAVLPEVEYGVHPLLAGVVIDLPTPKEINEFRGF